jgi:hypothetical protein
VFVEVGNTMPTASNMLATGNGNAICKYSATSNSFVGPGTNGQVVTFDCAPALSGRYVSVRIKGASSTESNILSLAEVEISGVKE